MAEVICEIRECERKTDYVVCRECYDKLEAELSKVKYTLETEEEDNKKFREENYTLKAKIENLEEYISKKQWELRNPNEESV